MKSPWFGQPMRRIEDRRFLQGEGRFVDDIPLPAVLHAAIVRSPLAHAVVRSIQTDAARSAPHVIAVYTATDLGELNRPSPLLVPHEALRHPRTQPPLAEGLVNYVGEAVAMVIAEDRGSAQDAAALVEVEYESLPVAASLEQAIALDAPLVHADVPDNEAACLIQQNGDPDSFFAQAALVVELELSIERGSAQPLETRAVAARWDAADARLTVWDSTQAPLPIRNGLAALFGLPNDSIRVIAPDVGGGFGQKIMMFYPEEVLVPFAAMRLGRPVKWVEGRQENLISSNQERGQIHRAAIALDSHGRILGVRDVFWHDAGAYTPYGIIVPVITATQLPGPYRIRNYYSEAHAVYTNRVTVSPYRGAGRPQGCFVIERLLDAAADRLGMDRAELRRRNLIQPDEFPWDVGLTFQDGRPTRYDSGNYAGGFDLALEQIGYAGFAEEQRRLRSEGRYIGLGMASYVEGTGIGPYEGAHLNIDGVAERVTVNTCVGTQGQGHQTSFAQLVADELGVEPSQVAITTGDSQGMSWGSGTYASRSAVVTGNAVGAAARDVRRQTVELAGELLEVHPDDLELAEGRVFVRGTPDRGLSLWELAVAANPIRYAYGKQAGEALALLAQRPREQNGKAYAAPGLEARQYFNPPQATFASGSHAAIVEVDVDTGRVKILRYVAVHDCGRVINPLIVEGQIRGGVAQGIGGSFFERCVYDESGQPLASSWMDYLVPGAPEVPGIECHHLETPSPLNPLGIKGAGEAGVIPVAALMARAVEDALSPWNVHITAMPLDAETILSAIRDGTGNRSDPLYS
ncbi:MAG: aerobic carbon-monoxide dehydrogenase large subunit [Chloroflexota bacterium]